MDDMRNRYRVPGRDDGQPAQPVHESLQHAYQAPPAPHRPAPPPVRTHVPPPPAPRHQPAAHVDNQPQPEAHYHLPSRPKRRLWRRLSVVLIVLLLLAGAGIYAYPRYVNANPFPASIQTGAGLSMFYPGKLPAGYILDKTSINLTNGVLLYNAADGDKHLVFTLQKTPTTFDFPTFYKQQLTGAQQYQTPYGQATVGKNSGRYLGSLTDGDTWLLLSTNSTAVSQDDISLVMTHLKKY
jgi:hypothetical protein